MGEDSEEKPEEDEKREGCEGGYMIVDIGVAITKMRYFLNDWRD